MLILAMDTACREARAALTDGTAVLGRVTLSDRRMHSEKLLPAVAELLRTNGVRPQQLGLLAVTNGPGSYTGLRIAVTTAKAMAYACDLPLVGVNTLDALAWHFRDDPRLVCPLIDARNARAYGGVYRGAVPVLPRFVQGCAETAALLSERFPEEPVLFCGDAIREEDDVRILRETLGTRCVLAPDATATGDVADVAALALHLWQASGGDREQFGENRIAVDYMKAW